MQSERRKIIRRAVNYPARIDLGNGSELVPCTLVDASDEGVQIVTAEPVEWPAQIELVLGYSGRRRCRIAWRNGRRAGLEFLKDGKRIPLVLPAEASKSTPETAPAAASPQPAAPLAPKSVRAQTAAEAFDIDTLPPAGPDPMQPQG
jgi:hypothetical protein